MLPAKLILSDWRSPLCVTLVVLARVVLLFKVPQKGCCVHLVRQFPYTLFSPFQNPECSYNSACQPPGVSPLSLLPPGLYFTPRQATCSGCTPGRCGSALDRSLTAERAP